MLAVNGRAESRRQQKWLLPRGCIITVTFTLTVNILYRESSLKPKPDAQNLQPEDRGRAILMGLYHHVKSYKFTYHIKNEPENQSSKSEDRRPIYLGFRSFGMYRRGNLEG